MVSLTSHCKLPIPNSLEGHIITSLLSLHVWLLNRNYPILSLSFNAICKAPNEERVAGHQIMSFSLSSFLLL